ncbi:MAG: PH domain-containing protein [Methyloceanibacter sp.]|jgi:uncharacterized membrane protein YdbT with pleckstrin-like domain
MSYIASVLQPGETVRYRGSVHWVLYLPAIFLVTIGGRARVAPLPFLLAAIFAIRAWLVRWMTEIAGTDRRVIYVHGFVERHTFEIHQDKIESVDVDQNVLGRMLDFGDVTIKGTGTMLEPLCDVDRPLALRNEITAR